MKKQGIIGIAISVVCLWLVFREVDFGIIREALLKANYKYLLPAIVLYMSGYFIRALRWQVMLAPLKPISFIKSFRVVMIAWAANNLLPARLGEIIRAYIIGKSESISRSAAFATIVVERVFDGLVLIGTLGILLLLHPFPSWVRSLGAIGTLMFLGAMAMLVSLHIWREKSVRIIRRLTTWLPQRGQQAMLDIIGKFLNGLQFFNRGSSALLCIFYSIVIWSIEACVVYIFFSIVGIDLPFYAAPFTLVIVNLAIIVPSSPGFVGVVQIAVVLALAVFGIPRETALSFAVLIHGVMYIVVTSVGFLSLHQLGWHWQDITHAKVEE